MAVWCPQMVFLVVETSFLSSSLHQHFIKNTVWICLVFAPRPPGSVASHRFYISPFKLCVIEFVNLRKLFYFFPRSLRLFSIISFPSRFGEKGRRWEIFQQRFSNLHSAGGPLLIFFSLRNFLVFCKTFSFFFLRVSFFLPSFQKKKEEKRLGLRRKFIYFCFCFIFFPPEFP